MTHTTTVEHLYVFSSLYIWRLSSLIFRNSVASNNAHQDMEGEKLATVAVEKKAIICI